MESNTARFPAVLSDLNMNIQDDVIKKSNSLSSSNTIKNSPSPSENKIEVIGNVEDQENIKPPGVECTPSCTEGVIFKKPLPRFTMPKEDCTLNSVIDELNHLKLGATPVKSKRFDFFKWTTPLKRKAPQSDDSCASSECSAFDRNPHSPPHDEKPVQDSSSNKSDKESGSNQNDDPDAGSDYYDCGEEENTANEPARVSEMSSDVSHTADSSFHSISEKEHANESDSKRVCEASLAEMNRTQDNDQAFILEKYLTEQDFKLEISLSEMSFNSAINNIEFDSSKRESISIQTENTISGSLFSFGLEEKSKFCLTDQQNFNDVTILPDPLNNARSFVNENEQQTEDSLFNLITDYMVQNETQTSFDLKREENMFTLSRISEAAFLHIDTVEEEDALLQKPAARKSLQPQIDTVEEEDASLQQPTARKSLQPQSSNIDSNESNATESEIQDDRVPIVPVSEKTEIRQTEPDIETEINEIASNMSRISISGQPTNVDQFSTNLSLADLADGAEKVTDESDSSLAETNQTISVEATEDLDENHVENNQVSPVAKLNVTVDLEPTATINEPVVEIDEASNEAADPVEEVSSPSSLNVTVGKKRISSGPSCSPLCRKSTQTAFFETDDSDFKQSIGLSLINQTVDLEVSQQFNLEIEDESLCYGNSNETVNLDKTQTFNDAATSNTNQTFDLDASQHLSLEIEDETSNKTVNLEETRTLNERDTMNANQTFDLEASQHFGLEIEDENLNKTVNLEETRPLSDSDAFESNQAVDLDSTKTISTEVEEDTSKDVCPDPTILNQTSSSVVPELGDKKISERSSHQETSDESVTLETNSAIVKSLAEQCQLSIANQPVSLDVAEVIIADKSDNEELDESVYLETTSTIYEVPAEAESPASNRTIAFGLEVTRVIGETSPLATHQMTDEKISERSLHQETFVESVTLETNSAIVKSLAEQCQLSIANQAIDLGIAEVVIENESDDDEFDEPDDIETTSTVLETPNESMALNRTVPFDLEATRVIGEEIAKNDESTFDQSVAFFETNQSNILESTRLVENRTDTIVESDNFNSTFEIGSSAPVEPSLEQTEAVYSEDVRVFDENTSNISDSASKSIDSELDTIKNESDETQQPLDLSTKVASDFTLPIADLPEQNESANLDRTTTIETESCTSLPEPTKPNETVTMYEDTAQFIPHSPEPVGSAYDTDIYMEIEEMTTGRNEIVTDICLGSAEIKINVIPTPSTESIFKNSPSRFEIADEYLSPTVMRTESSFSKETQALNISCPKQFEDTVMIQGSPCPRRSDSPCQFDVHAIPSNEPASPIPPNSPSELSNKWQTQVDLSSVADHLECITGRDSPSNSSDELDITDPVDSNMAPEMLPTGKLPPGINRSYSNLESIPEMNEVEEPSMCMSEKDVNQDTKDQKPLEIGAENVESKPEAVSNQTTISNSSEELQINDVLSSTQIPTPSETESKPETCLDKSITAGAPLNTTDLIFKTPIAKLPKQSDLSALNDSSFNADYCCARTASAKASQSFRQSLISPKHSFLKGSTPIYSCTPNRRVRQTTPKASGDIPPSLLDLSIGYFVRCPATQVGPSELPETDANKTIDVDEEQPKHEETKLLYLDEPSRKVNVKTQTHDTELSDLQAENAKLKEDLNALMELAQATADNEVELKKTIQALAHNEAELKETVQKLEDNNRILNNKYQLLTEYSNELIARRNKELEEAEEKIRALQIKLIEFSKKSKTEASSK